METGVLEVAIMAAKKAGRFLLKNFSESMQVSSKGDRANLVTDMDLKSENMLVSTISKKFPSHGIIAEEKGRYKTSSKYNWYIDPLDGTVNYVHGFPVFAVSIAFEKNGIMNCGVVFNPVMDELFYAVRGKGTYRNGQRIKVSNESRLEKSFLVTGFPYYQEGREDNLRYFNEFIRVSQAIRRMGSAALDLCYVACGIFDGFWEFGLSSWDLAAGILIVNEAKGKITDFSGNRCDINKGEIIASNGLIHSQMISVLKRLPPYRPKS